ncbi:MAG: DUF983 domain-containing protein [Bacteroidetes bacterium]|nr:DUF983 domain-containing protein [Bacteroidota bacterium]MBS1649804.1 DUF983 domain-containing protein [Bacteroidota bacterium]
MKPLQYLIAVFTNKCPRCRKGYLYKTTNPYNLKQNTRMNEHCPVCGQPTDLEVGFYYGTGYVSYALSLMFLAISFILWKVFIGLTFDIDDNRIIYWMIISIGLLILCQPLIMRLSRTLWLSWFVKYDANWKYNKPEQRERVVEEHMHNW